MKAPAFQFYADDFLSGTITMTDAEVGLYIRLLCHQWNSGGLPNDNAEIELHSRGGTPLKRVLAKFQVGDDGLLRNARLEGVRAQQDSHREKQSKRGTAGAEARWNNAQAMLKHPLSIAQASPKHPSSIAQAMLRDGSPTPTPTPTPTITPKKNNTHPQSIHHGGTRELRAVDVDDAGVRRAELVHEYVSNYGDPCWYIP